MGHLAATKSQCVHTQENVHVAATCPLVCADNVWRVQHEFLQHFVPATCCTQSNELRSVQHVAGTKLPQNRPCHMSPQCEQHMILSLLPVAATCPCDMSPRVRRPSMKQFSVPNTR